MEKVYVERLEEGNQMDTTEVEFPEQEEQDTYGVFTEDEVREVLKELKRNTAAGIDGIRTPDLRKLPTGHVTAIMNHWWGWILPEKSEECRTTLLLKKDKELEKVGNWRPITVGNLLMRVYAKLWDKRLRQHVTLDERQKGFVPVNGCYENVKILQEIVKQQRKRRREYNLVFIDLAKAFDMVSHQSIKKGPRRKEIPEQVIRTIIEMYSKATTTISVGGKTTRRVKINAGMKQGCQLSPLLFNLIIDELIEDLKGTRIGVKLNGHPICCMAFAEDLVLISEEKIHMQILIERSKHFFDCKGLSANAGKCASLRVVLAGKKRTLKVITAKHRKWGPEDIPSLTFKDLVRYLGVELEPDGTVKLPRKTWNTYLENLQAAHLNPIQKIEATHQIVIAKIQYQLRLSDHGLEEARKLNRLIRKHVKTILHLPTWTSTAWIHHRNGVNIPDLVSTTMISRVKAARKMKTSTDPAASYTGDQVTPTEEDRLARLGLSTSINPKEDHQKRLIEEIGKMNNGRAVTTVMNSRHRRGWLWTQRGLKPGNKLRLIQALSSTLPTKINKTRGIQDRNQKLCMRCKKKEIEDDAHILSRCPFNKDLYRKRRNYIVRKIVKEVAKSSESIRVWHERSWRRGTALLRLDITIVDGDSVKIIKVTVPYETSPEYLESRRHDKIHKYKQLIEEELEQVQCTQGEVIPIVIGALGTITESTRQDLKKLNLQNQMDALQMTVATGSITILNNHFRRNDFR